MADWRAQACHEGRRRGRLEPRSRVMDAGTERCSAVPEPATESRSARPRRNARAAAFGNAHYSRVIRSRNAFPTTLTDDSAIAAAAMIGDSNRPNAG